LDKIQQEIGIIIDPSRILGQKSCTKHSHFLTSNPNKPIFHKNLNIFVFKYHDAYIDNTLLIVNTLYKILLNTPFNAIFMETFERSQRDDNYLVQTFLPYLEALQFSKLGVPSFVEENPFGNIRH
jgi:hypothetical protein